jgi:hypothetical protein
VTKEEELMTEHYTPKPGDIGLTTISGAGGKLIRLGQWLNGDGFGDREHAFVWIGPVEHFERTTAGETRVSPAGENMIVEAMPGGAQQVPNWHTDCVYLRCPDEHRNAVAAAALRYVGVPYSFLDYGALALHRFHIPTPHLKRFISDGGHQICSQLADQAAADGGWHLFKNVWPGDVTPGDLARLYRKQAYA